MEIGAVFFVLGITILHIFFFGYCSYSIMKKNGFNKKRWFLLGAILGLWGEIIAYIIVAASKKKYKKWKKCPACAEKVKAEAKVCRFCGHSFE